MGVVNPPSTKSTSTDSATPGICKELIGQSLARLRGCSSGTDESVADRLASDLFFVFEAVQAISDLYDSLDDDSQENGESTEQKGEKLNFRWIEIKNKNLLPAPSKSLGLPSFPV